MINPIPYIKINGVTIPAGLDADGDFTSVVASGFTLQWGRSDYMDQPQAGSLSVTLYDKTGAWASATDLIGLSVEAGMTYSGKSRIIFRGRIMSAELTYMQTLNEPIFAVALNCTDKIGELGQTYISDRLWLGEYYSGRIAKIMAAGANKIIAGIGGGLETLIDDVQTGDSTLLTLIQDAMETVGDRMAYDPATNRIEAMGRFSVKGNVLRLALNAEGMYGVELSSDYEGQSSITANGLQSSSGMTRSIASGITEIRIGHNRFDMAAGESKPHVTARSTGINETVFGRRVLKVETQLYDTKLSTGEVINTYWIDRLLNEYVDMALYEGRQWSHPPVTWDARRNGGFRTEAELFALLRCTEARVPVYFPNSVYNSINAQAPVHRIIGGTVEFIGGPEGGWISTVNLGPVKVLNTNAPVTWATINTSTTETVTWELLDNSVTATALASVTQGVS